MKKLFSCLVVISLIFAASCKSEKEQMKRSNVKPPTAEKQPKELVKHGDVRVDNYYWMRLSDEQKNSENPDEHTQKVLDYLNAENVYYDTITAHTKDFKEALFSGDEGKN